MIVWARPHSRYGLKAGLGRTFIQLSVLPNTELSLSCQNQCLTLPKEKETQLSEEEVFITQEDVGLRCAWIDVHFLVVP